MNDERSSGMFAAFFDKTVNNTTPVPSSNTSRKPKPKKKNKKAKHTTHALVGSAATDLDPHTSLTAQPPNKKRRKNKANSSASDEEAEAVEPQTQHNKSPQKLPDLASQKRHTRTAPVTAKNRALISDAATAAADAPTPRKSAALLRSKTKPHSRNARLLFSQGPLATSKSASSVPESEVHKIASEAALVWGRLTGMRGPAPIPDLPMPTDSGDEPVLRGFQTGEDENESEWEISSSEEDLALRVDGDGGDDEDDGDDSPSIPSGEWEDVSSESDEGYSSDDSEDELKKTVVTSKELKAQQVPETAKVFLGQVPAGVSSHELDTVLSSCGPIKSVLVTKHKSGLPTVAAFVEFETAKHAAIALKLGKIVLAGKQVEITPCLKETITCPEGCTTLYIKNLAFTTTETKLRSIFSSCGEILNVRLPRHSDTNKSKGSAFITFDSSKALEFALAKNRVEVDGRQLLLEPASSSPSPVPMTTTKLS
ncbi:nucleolin [Pelomyxa schiedti]|nr:nucleolin [Pelomyxa schiedti]